MKDSGKLPRLVCEHCKEVWVFLHRSVGPVTPDKWPNCGEAHKVRECWPYPDTRPAMSATSGTSALAMQSSSGRMIPNRAQHMGPDHLLGRAHVCPHAAFTCSKSKM